MKETLIEYFNSLDLNKMIQEREREIDLYGGLFINTKFVMDEDLENYLSNLSFVEIVDYYEVAIRHNHYCPCECHCFDDYKMHASPGEIKQYILKQIKRGVH